jgi:succinyl-CoA synthetase alpha subunit
MAILIDKNTRLLVQGITGTEAQRSLSLMKSSGTVITCGVTPGKGGQSVEGIPVYNTVAEALKKHPETNASFVSVPPFAAKDAAIEAVFNGIKLVVCITENVPARDAAFMARYAQAHGAIFIGPGSVGVIAPGIGRIGPIGGLDTMASEIYQPGSVGVVSTSGGMTNEVAWIVRQAGFGHSTVLSIGGEKILGTTFADILRHFEQDTQTKAVVLFGELGGHYENQIAALIREKKFTKPLIAFIAGTFTESLPKGIQFGHAAALLNEKESYPTYKKQALRTAGVHVADSLTDIPDKLREVL